MDKDVILSAQDESSSTLFGGTMPEHTEQHGSQPTDFNPSNINIPKSKPKVFNAPEVKASEPVKKVKEAGAGPETTSKLPMIMASLCVLLSLLALGLAIFTTLHASSGEKQLVQLVTQVEKVNLDLGAAKIELAKYKLSRKHGQDEIEGGQKRLGREVDVLYQSIRPLQSKLKIKPVLEE